jgi:hypothetical protein
MSTSVLAVSGVLVRWRMKWLCRAAIDRVACACEK